ncbi:MAG: hypothetical protein PHH93_00135 [Prolixibacteraceae bacterium]|nr:hypothetical protein [Prolixibacteraceae bacterium]
MFTVGIFTTHLPYIAFVFFYAFFFLIGIQNSSDENSEKQEHTLNSIIAGPAETGSHIDGSNYNFNDYCSGSPPDNANTFVIKKAEYLFHPKTCLKPVDIQFELYCRPPPAA